MGVGMLHVIHIAKNRERERENKTKTGAARLSSEKSTSTRGRKRREVRSNGHEAPDSRRKGRSKLNNYGRQRIWKERKSPGQQTAKLKQKEEENRKKDFAMESF